MLQMRRGTFETNSSSVHSLTIVSKEEFDKFKNGEYYMDYNENFISLEDIKMEILEDGNKIPDNEDEFNNLLRDMEYRTYENFAGEYYEEFETHHTTKNGDKIVAFGYYGDN